MAAQQRRQNPPTKRQQSDRWQSGNGGNGSTGGGAGGNGGAGGAATNTNSGTAVGGHGGSSGDGVADSTTGGDGGDNGRPAHWTSLMRQAETAAPPDRRPLMASTVKTAPPGPMAVKPIVNVGVLRLELH